jgi:ElaB/YqjD/DUF883 family membrane-anchored ribosome-binding protein
MPNAATTDTDARARLASELAQSKNRLVSDFKTLVTDAEALVRATGNYGGEGFAQARVKFEEQVEHLKDVMADAQSYAVEKGKQAAAVTDDYVHANPWQAIGIAAAIGVIAGILAGRRAS